MQKFSGILHELIENALVGKKLNVDFIMKHLNINSSLEITRYVDYAMSLIKNDIGIKRLEYYLFNGCQIQRNYCSLYFNRKGDWSLVKKAYQLGLIDEIQAFAR